VTGREAKWYSGRCFFLTAIKSSPGPNPRCPNQKGWSSAAPKIQEGRQYCGWRGSHPPLPAVWHVQRYWINAAVLLLAYGKPSVGLDLLHPIGPVRADSRQQNTAGAISKVTGSALNSWSMGESRWFGDIENQFSGICWRRFHLQPFESGGHIEFSGTELAGVGNRDYLQRGNLVE